MPTDRQTVARSRLTAMLARYARAARPGTGSGVGGAGPARYATAGGGGCSSGGGSPAFPSGTNGSPPRGQSAKPKKKSKKAKRSLKDRLRGMLKSQAGPGAKG